MEKIRLIQQQFMVFVNTRNARGTCLTVHFHENSWPGKNLCMSCSENCKSPVKHGAEHLEL